MKSKPAKKQPAQKQAPAKKPARPTDPADDLTGGPGEPRN
jgi:hypothetical protein